MTIDDFLQSYNSDMIVSEQDVRTKVSNILLDCLGYPMEMCSEEFPVYGYEGRTQLNAKLADTMVFNIPGFENHRKRKDRAWVMDHSLIAIELKKPSESINDSQGQAQFYAMWVRCKYYICTDGIRVLVYKLGDYKADIKVCDCLISELTTQWTSLYSEISYEVLKSQKIEPIETKTLPFQEYCISKTKDDGDAKWWPFEQQLEKINKEERDIITLSDIERSSDNILLLAEAGMGKTSIMLQMIQYKAKMYLAEKSTSIPILISAKFWKRNLNSLLEGIIKELQPFIPSMTACVARAELSNNNLCLFLDGLDECFIDRDILIAEVKELLASYDIQIVISCRDSFYYNELTDLKTYRVLPLSDDDLHKISENVLGHNISPQIYSMDQGLKELIRTPLYFYMWLTYCKRHEGHEIPANKSVLLDNFCRYLLHNFLTDKGNYDHETIPTETLNNVFSLYAFKTLDVNSKYKLSDALMQLLGNTDILSKVTKIGFQSGLLYNVEDIIDFKQYSIKEFFCAYYLNGLEEKEAINFLNNHHSNKQYHEIIGLWVGLLQNESTQNLVLDYLEEHNLPLYIKCLNKRYNFSNVYETNFTKKSCESFFSQILSTYENIVEYHFVKIKEYFCPWLFSHQKPPSGIYTTIEATISLISLHIFIELGYTNDITANRLMIDYEDDSKPQITAVREEKKVITPVLSFTDNLNHFYFDLNKIYHGMDCAREIAIDMIRKNLKRILNSPSLVLKEPPFMQVEYLEYLLEKISPVSIKTGEETKTEDFSLKVKTLQDIASIFERNPNYCYTYRGKKGSEKVEGVILFLLAHNNLEAGIDLSKIVFPDMDKELGGDSHWVFDYYSTETIKQWLYTHYDEFQKSYRVFVETVFPDIKAYLSMYAAGPFKYLIYLNRDNQKVKPPRFSGILGIKYEPMENLSECNPDITTLENVQEWHLDFAHHKEYFEKLDRKLRFLGRSNSSFYGLSYEELSSVFATKNSVRKEVYKQLEQDFRTIFGKW